MTDTSLPAAGFSTRRDLLGTGLAAVVVIVLPSCVWATPQEVARSITDTFGEHPFTEGRISLSVPALAETGNSVPVTVRVDSAMTAQERIRRLAIFAEANPRPKIAEVVFGPAAAEAHFTTNIRLSGTQRIVCVAEASDGTLMSAAHEVRVVVGACTTLDSRY